MAVEVPSLPPALLGLVGPGGRYEIGDDTYYVNHIPVRAKCFLGGPRTLGEFCDLTFPKHRESTFLVFENERYTFGEVEAAVAAFGHALVHDFGCCKGDRVAVSMRNYPEWVIAFIAAMRIGCIAVPLNSLWGPEEMGYGLKDSGAKVLVCDAERLSRATGCLADLGVQVVLAQAASTPVIAGVRVESMADVIRGAKGQPVPVVQVAHDDFATIMYTSGTTGKPKGVVQTHRGVCSQLTMGLLADEMRAAEAAAAGAAGVTPAPPGDGSVVLQPCILAPVPLFHVTGSHHILLASLVEGRKLVLMVKWDAGKALELIERERATSWTGVPTMVQDLMEHPDFSRRDVSTLKSIGGGGGPFPAGQHAKTTKAFKGSSAGQGYGLTETNGAVCGIGGDAQLAKPRSCGTPFPIVEFLVVDADTTAGAIRPVGPEQPGELLIRSPLVMSHYWKRPEASANSLVEVPGQGPGWFRSGDIARLDAEGSLFIMDRQKDIIIRGGENISCAEVESAFFDHPAVMESAAFAVKDARLGEIVGLRIVVKQDSALRIATSEAQADLARDLIRSVTERLAKFKIPLLGNISFQTTPLPRGATGKILKRQIRQEVNQSATRVKAPRSRL